MSSADERPSIAPLERVPTGVPGLDAILGGGLLRGSAYIVQGPPGAGKTIVANQVAFQTGDTLYLTLLAESFGQMFSFLQPMSFFDIERVPRDVYYSSVYATAREEGLDGLSRLVMREIRERAPKVVVIDGLFAITEGAVGETSAHEFRRFVGDLSALAAQTRTTMLLLTNANRQPSSPEYTMVDGWIELRDDFHKERARRTIIAHKHRGSAILRGQHEYRVTDDGVSVFPRLEVMIDRDPGLTASTARLSTGIDALDEMMRGGYPEHSSTVVLGPTGSGKTTIGTQFLGKSTKEEPGLLFGFYETPERLYQKAKGVGLDLEPLIESGALKVVWCPPLENLIDDIGQRILTAVKAHGAKRVVIDGINGFGHAIAADTRLHGFIRALNDLLKAEGATIVYTREVAQLFFPDALTTAELAGTIDNTILVHYALNGNSVSRRVTILKVRDSDFDHVSRRFDITGDGIVFSDEGGEDHELNETISAAPTANMLPGAS